MPIRTNRNNFRKGFKAFVFISVFSGLLFLASGSLSPASGAEDELLAELKKLVSPADLPPGFQLEGGYQYDSKESRDAHLNFKGPHPFHIRVDIEEIFYSDSSAHKYDWVLEDLKSNEIISTNIGLAEKSLHHVDYLGTKRIVSQQIYLYHQNWVLKFRMSWYSATQEAPMTDEQAGRFLKDLATKVFNRFLGLERQPLEIRPLAGDLSGNELADGDVVLLVTDFNRPEGIPFAVSCPEGLEVKIELQNWHRRMVTVSGPGLEPTDDGYKVNSADGRVNFRLDFDPQALKDYRENFPGGPAVVVPVDVDAGADKRTLFVQLTPWELVITRFEIRQRGGESTRAEAVRGTTRTIEPYEFNQHIDHQGKLWDTWDKKLHPEVKTRYSGGFAASEPVIMAWGLNGETQESFFTAQADSSGSLDQVPAYNAEAELIVEFDLEIIRDPKVETDKSSTMDEWSENTTKKIQNWELQRELWREYQVDEFEITVHEVDPEAQNMRRTAQTASFLREPVDTLRPEKDLTGYVNLKMLDRTGLQLIYDVTARPYPFGPLRKPGIYEIRMKMKVVPKFNLEDFRQVDVAVRIKALKGSFDFVVLEWTSQRK
jgi:hypothetical protein